MTPNAADIEEKLLQILKENRPGKDVRGCMNHLEVYDRAIQKEVIEPLFKELGAQGQIQEIDDLGHDTHFKTVWNRALRGQCEDWDCRTLANIFVTNAVGDVPDFFRVVFKDDYDAIDAALVKNLPDILSGGGMRPYTGQGLKSWVTGEHVDIKMDGLQAVFCARDGSTLQPPPRYIAYKDSDPSPEPVEIYGLMSFHCDEIDYDTSIKAWQAWSKAMKDIELNRRDQYDSIAGRMLMNLLPLNEIGISQMMLRQDESVSVEAGPDGVIAYRGEVRGLKRLVDEGQFLCGPRDRFAEVLEAGGFSKSGAGAFLDTLAQSSSAFSALAPAGSNFRYMLDPETLLAFEQEGDEVLYDLDKADALPIMAAGIFEMPEMITHRDREARKLAADVSNELGEPQ